MKIFELLTGSIALLLLSLSIFPALLSYFIDNIFIPSTKNWLSNATITIELISRYIFSLYFMVISYLVCIYEVCDASLTLISMLIYPSLLCSKTIMSLILLPFIKSTLIPMLLNSLKLVLERILGKIEGKK